MRSDIIENENQIRVWIKQNQSKAFICQKLNCKPSTLNSYLNKMGIKYDGNMGGKGIKSDPKRKSAIEYTESTLVKSHVLKLKLIEDGLKERKCEICLLSDWQGQEIPLELHHIDGNRFNNKMDNLQILCSNCHSQTPNNSGKKTKKNGVVAQQVEQ